MSKNDSASLLKSKIQIELNNFILFLHFQKLGITMKSVVHRTYVLEENI